jgi:hypothetical protein
MPIEARTVTLPTVWDELSHALLMQGHNERALEVCEAGIEAHPRSMRLWQKKGTILGHVGRLKEAIGALERCISLAGPEQAKAVAIAKKQIKLAKRDVKRG